jgi:peroxiredoxin Q/BCP
MVKEATALKNAPLKAGDNAPDFTMATDGGGSISLKKLAGKKVVFYFYPKDDTPGCTIEAKEFRDHMKEFEKNNSAIIGVSKDSVQSHEKFKEKFCLPFILAADENGVCEAYGVWVEKSMYGKKYMGIERTTFLIDGKGKIAQVWNKVKPEGHAAEVLEAVKKLG